jgi:hypothetical protein
MKGLGLDIRGLLETVVRFLLVVDAQTLIQ